jgi:hypothetical protein
VRGGFGSRFYLGSHHACRILVSRLFRLGDRMRLCRYLWVACLIIATLFHGVAMAAAVPAYTGRMNTAVGGVVSQKVGKWGFAPNDPRFTATMTGVGAGVTGLVVGGLGVAVGAATWPAVLVAAGVTALVSGAVSWGQDSLYKWAFNSNGTVSTQGSPVGSVPAGYGAMTAGGPYYQAAYGSTTWRAGGAAGPVAAYVQALHGTPVWPWFIYSENASAIWVYVDNPAGNGGNAHWDSLTFPKFSSGAPATCAAGQVYTAGACTAAVGYISPVTDLSNASVADAIAAMPNAELAKPLSNEMLAAAVNAAWRAMPSTTSNALPWSPTDPVTPDEVAVWKAANPTAVPTVGQAIEPVAAPSATAVPITQPGATPATGPAPTPGTGAPVDLGPNPNIGAPTLEGTPTAQSILDPLLNLMPDLKNFTVPAHSTDCPKPSFSAFSQTYVIASHCDLFESNRSIIEAAMLLVWTIGSVIIVLRA